MQMICILLECRSPNDIGCSRRSSRSSTSRLAQAALSQLSVEEAGSRMYSYGQQLIASKRAEPTDDMLSVVANATVDELGGPVPSISRCICSSVCCSVPRGDDPQLGRGACWRWHSIRSNCVRCVLISTAADAVERWCAGRRHRRRSGVRTAMSHSADRHRGGQKVQVWRLGQSRRKRIRPRRRVRHRA